MVALQKFFPLLRKVLQNYLNQSHLCQLQKYLSCHFVCALVSKKKTNRKQLRDAELVEACVQW